MPAQGPLIMRGLNVFTLCFNVLFLQRDRAWPSSWLPGQRGVSLMIRQNMVQ